PPSPRLFTPAAIDFEPDPNAPPPTKWLTFLNDIFDGDTEQIETLQEWAGYLLTPDTKYQKALFMVGPRRCGKGTITRLLTAMIGSANCASPTTMSFAAQFGLAGLVGKTAAFINDARFQGNNVPLIVERLLNITGEDAIEVERKFRDSVSIRLSTRFTISSNELPKFTDASNALIGRFIVLRFTKSFYDREDTTLEDKLRTELPGILNWSLEGWKRLNQRCKFVQPKAGRDAVRELEELSSPVTAFVRKKCVLDPEKKIEMDRLYRCYEAWCVSTGMKHATTSSPVFSRNLTSAYPTITRGRPTIGDERIRFFKGIDTVDFFV
ncbi:MAG TPA: phage/plasmid primase, P4 family, partial [Tepidisphaeraceae bacterium]|nr:phage/plasmid primase, P4 family [Tepidisphaeraceae bacterium]